jgi:ketosteroid isomerase-like protein
MYYVRRGTLMTKMMLAACAGLLVSASCSKKQDAGPSHGSSDGSAVTTPPPPPTPVPPKKLEGAELAEKYKSCVDLVNAGKIDELAAECLADSYVSHDVPAGTQQDKGAFVEWLKSNKRAFPDWKLAPAFVLVNGRNLAAIHLSTGTHRGPLKTVMGDAPASNKRHAVYSFQHLAFDDANKASEEWAGFSDVITLWGQLGQFPDSPPAVVVDQLPAPGVIVVSAGDAKERSNLEVVKQEFELRSHKKFAEASALYAKDAEVVDSIEDHAMKGAKQIEAFHKERFGLYAKLALAVQNVWAGGNYVVQTVKLSGLGADHGSGPKPRKDGIPVTRELAEVFKLEGGKIVQVRRFENVYYIARQLGFFSDVAASGSAAGSAGSGSAGSGSAGSGSAGSGSAAPPAR